jgi:hypothetical protein
MKKIIILVLVFGLLAGLSGCKTVSDIASNVAEAAGKELEAQIQQTLEKNKVTVLELKTTAGKLNDNGGKLQFYCAALVTSQNYDTLVACADAIDKVFEIAGVAEQTGKKIESPYLVHKSLEFKHELEPDVQYYIIYAYISDFSIDLPDFTIPEITLPSFPSKIEKNPAIPLDIVAY